MKTKKVGLILFWIAAVYVFVMGFVINWWVTPMYKYTPAAEVNETVWAVGGPLFFVWAFAIPIGLTLAAVGMSLRAEPRKSWSFVIVGIFIILSVIFPQTLGYHIGLFGALGGLIVFFLVMLWY